MFFKFYVNIYNIFIKIRNYVSDVANVTENLEINVSIWNWNKLSSNG